jgi:asparagine synthase (glutamine-hydrolysing)
MAVTSRQAEDECLLDPYFHVRVRSGRYETRGHLSARLGHQLTSVQSGCPDGIFAEWSWDREALSVWNDRYGFYPLYYFHRDGEFAISPSLITLLALGASPELDHDALAVFLRLGNYLGEATPFREIRAVPPHASLRWGRDGLSIECSFAFSRPLSLSRDAAIDAYSSLFEDAVRRRAPDDGFVVLLSGGRDSRHILLELARQGRKPKYAVTVRPYAPDRPAEVEVARQLADETKIRHVVVDQVTNPYLSELRKNLLASFCAAHDEHAWIMPAVDYLEGCHMLYDGIGGDVLSAGLYLTPSRVELMEKGRFLEVAETLLCDEGAFSMLKAERGGRESAKQQLATELARHANAPNPIGSFIFWNRTRRHIALSPYALFSRATTVFSPYLDHAVYDLLAGLSAGMMVDHKFHSDVIAKRYPEYSHIPYSPYYDETRERRDQQAYRHFQFYRQFASEVLRSCFSTDGPLKPYALLVRLIRCLADPHYSSSIMWLGPLVIYMTQLSRLQSRFACRRAHALARSLP